MLAGALDGIFKHLRSIGIDFTSLLYVVWRVCTSKRVVVPVRQAGNRFLGSLKGLQMRALESLRIILVLKQDSKAAKRQRGQLRSVLIVIFI